MQKMNFFFKLISILILSAGCVATTGNKGNLSTYEIPALEKGWIRDGEPIEFEGERWYPQDDIEILADSEVLLMGQYQGVTFFVDRADVRPFSRLLTKFSKNKFRVFEKTFSGSHD